MLYAVTFYLRNAISDRDLEEILAERGVDVHPATLNRWVVKLSPLLAAQAWKHKRSCHSSWRMDETYVKVKGKWVYLYRAADKYGDTVVFMISERRNCKVARRFFKKSINRNGAPEKVAIDKSSSNLAA